MNGASWSGAVLPLVTAGLLAYVGVLMARRPVSPGARFPMRAFSAWWFAVALVNLLSSAPTWLSLAGVTDARVYAAFVYAIAAPLAAALFSLLSYLLYIYTGRRAAAVPLGLAYFAFFLFALYYFSSFGTYRVESSEWMVRTAGDAQPPAWLSALFGITLAGPVLAAVVGYASLYARVDGSEQRFRVAMVSAAFGVLFVPTLAGFLAGVEDAAWFHLVYPAAGLLGAILVVVGFRPPAALQAHWRAAAEPRAEGP